MENLTESEDLKLFIGHKRPEFPIWTGYKHFGLENLPEKSGEMTDELLNHRLLNEYAFLFQLRRKLQDLHPYPQRVTLYQYRRFLVHENIGLPSKNLPWANVLSTSDVLAIGDKLSLLVGPSNGHNFQISPILKVEDSVLRQYARHHLCRDVLRFTSDLVDAKILTNNEALDLLTQKALIPTPACGTFETRFLLQALRTIEKATEVFLKNGYLAYSDPYQGRVMGFLLERFHSYLLLQHLSSIGENPAKLCGRMIIVSDELMVKHGLACEEVRPLGGNV